MSTTVQEQLENSIGTLLALSDSTLELELGRRLSQTKKELVAQPTLSVDSTAPKLDDADLQVQATLSRTLAKKFLNDVGLHAYSLIHRSPDIQRAAAEGIGPLATVLCTELVVKFGLMPGIASVLGVMIAKIGIMEYSRASRTETDHVQTLSTEAFHDRYHELVDRRLTGVIGADESRELERIEARLDAGDEGDLARLAQFREEWARDREQLVASIEGLIGQLEP